MSATARRRRDERHPHQCVATKFPQSGPRCELKDCGWPVPVRCPTRSARAWPLHLDIEEDHIKIGLIILQESGAVLKLPRLILQRMLMGILLEVVADNLPVARVVVHNSSRTEVDAGRRQRGSLSVSFCIPMCQLDYS